MYKIKTVLHRKDYYNQLLISCFFSYNCSSPLKLLFIAVKICMGVISQLNLTEDITPSRTMNIVYPTC